MILTNDQCYGLYQGLQALKEYTLPVKIGYRILRNLKLIEDICIAVEELRHKLLLPYQTEGDKTAYFIPIEDRNKVNKELYDLGQVVNDIPLVTIPLDDLESISLPLEILNMLFPIIESGQD